MRRLLPKSMLTAILAVVATVQTATAADTCRRHGHPIQVTDKYCGVCGDPIQATGIKVDLSRVEIPHGVTHDVKVINGAGKVFSRSEETYLDQGHYTVRITFSGEYEPLEVPVDVTYGQLVPVTPELKRVTGDLHIEAPERSTSVRSIALDGATISGALPYTAWRLRPGEHSIIIRYANPERAVYDPRVIIEAGTMAKCKPDSMRDMAKTELMVRIKSREAATSPKVVVKNAAGQIVPKEDWRYMHPGTYKVNFDYGPGFAREFQTVTLPYGQSRTIDAPEPTVLKSGVIVEFRDEYGNLDSGVATDKCPLNRWLTFRFTSVKTGYLVVISVMIGDTAHINIGYPHESNPSGKYEAGSTLLIPSEHSMLNHPSIGRYQYLLLLTEKRVDVNALSGLRMTRANAVETILGEIDKQGNIMEKHTIPITVVL